MTSAWEAVGRAQAEFFGDIRPATTMQISRRIDSRLLVEIEAEAIIDGLTRYGRTR